MKCPGVQRVGVFNFTQAGFDCFSIHIPQHLADVLLVAAQAFTALDTFAFCNGVGKPVIQIE